VDFLLVLIELFSLGVRAEALRVNIDRKLVFLKRRGQFGPKFQYKGLFPPAIFPGRKPDEWTFYILQEFWQNFFFILSQFMHWRDGQTDRPKSCGK